MEPVTLIALQNLFKRLGERFSQPAIIYLLGGSALCLLGSPRETLDIDYSLESDNPNLHAVLNQLAMELNLDLEAVPLAEFIPLPPETEHRRRFIGRFSQVDVYIFDLYSLALSKIARGFESDLEDVQFLLTKGFINWTELECHFENILPRVSRADINPKEFLSYFDTLKKRQI